MVLKENGFTANFGPSRLYCAVVINFDELYPMSGSNCMYTLTSSLSLSCGATGLVCQVPRLFSVIVHASRCCYNHQLWPKFMIKRKKAIWSIWPCAGNTARSLGSQKQKGVISSIPITLLKSWFEMKGWKIWTALLFLFGNFVVICCLIDVLDGMVSWSIE